MRQRNKMAIMLMGAAAFGGCTVHPAGESQERAAALRAGAVYDVAPKAQRLPVLEPDAAPDQLVSYALVNNGALEQKYWQWRGALEEVPQAGTQETALSVSFSSMINSGRLAWDTTTLGAGNDSMHEIVLPGKLAASAATALEKARATGLHFDEARFELRARILTAYDDYALSAELARLEQDNIALLELMQRLTQSRLATGGATQVQFIKAASALELAKNDLAARQAAFPRQVAAINALLNRAPEAPIAVPKELPAARPLPESDGELLAAAARDNPELQALARELAAGQDSVRRAKLEFVPDFSVSVGTDLQGMAQSLGGSLMVPAVRYQAIDAAIRQAAANLRAAAALRRQAAHDVASRIVGDLATLRDAQRQADVLETNILPRLREVVASTRNSYATGQATLLDMLDGQRALIGVRRLWAQMRIERENQVVDIEAAIARPIGRGSGAVRGGDRD